ncbi:hypothetical protein MVEG_00236 [Podila verticillata NRRL 6337]|nr:hypothetical protein MVEG_00236 [Podila verticillata NRRL 6337]
MFQQQSLAQSHFEQEESCRHNVIKNGREQRHKVHTLRLADPNYVKGSHHDLKECRFFGFPFYDRSISYGEKDDGNPKWALQGQHYRDDPRWGCLGGNLRNEYFLAREDGFLLTNMYNFDWHPDLPQFLDSELNRNTELWYGVYLNGSSLPPLTQEMVVQREYRMLQRWAIWILNGGPSPEDRERRKRLCSVRDIFTRAGILKAVTYVRAGPWMVAEPTVNRTGAFREPTPQPQPQQAAH